MKKVGLVIGLMAVIFFTGCEPIGKRPVSEDTIKADIEKYENFITEDQAEFNGFQITDRYTRMDDGSDRVVGVYSLKNDVMEVNGNFNFYYELYDDGWKLLAKEFEIDESTLSTKGVDIDTIINDAIEAGYDEVEYEEELECDNAWERKYLISTIEKDDFVSVKRYIEVMYKFEVYNMQWDCYNHDSAESTPIFNIDGSYEYYEAENGGDWKKARIKISDFEDATNTFMLYFEMTGNKEIMGESGSYKLADKPYQYIGTAQAYIEDEGDWSSAYPIHIDSEDEALDMDLRLYTDSFWFRFEGDDYYSLSGDLYRIDDFKEIDSKESGLENGGNNEIKKEKQTQLSKIDYSRYEGYNSIRVGTYEDTYGMTLNGEVFELNDVFWPETSGDCNLIYTFIDGYSSFSGCIYVPYKTCYYERFSADIFFEIYGDGALIYKNHDLNRNSVDPIYFDVDISGVREMKIVLNGVNSEDSLYRPEICMTKAVLHK